MSNGEIALKEYLSIRSKSVKSSISSTRILTDTKILQKELERTYKNGKIFLLRNGTRWFG
jgi:hypothetical protein